MRLNKATIITLACVLAAIFGLAGWGHHLGLEPGTLDAVRTGAAALGAALLAVLRSVLSADKDGDGVPDILKTLGLMAVLCVVGCGANMQGVISGQAAVLVATQPDRVDFYQALSDRCEADASDVAEYRACMAPAKHVQRAADSYRDTLFAAQAALAIEGADALSAVACAVGAARDLVRALQSANVPVPDEVDAVADLIPEGVCQ